jgi:hypothetical protein
MPAKAGAPFHIRNIPTKGTPDKPVLRVCKVVDRECEAADARESTSHNLHESAAESLFAQICT